MRVGMITTSFPGAGAPASGSFVLEMARALAAAGHQVEVVAPAHEGGPSHAEPAPGVAADFIRYAPRPLARTFHGAGVADNLRASPRAWPGLLTGPAALYAAARRRVGRWDALVSHWALPSALIAGAVRGPRAHLAVLHSADVALLTRLPARWALASRVLAGASHLRFVSTPLRERFAECLPRGARAELMERSSVEPMGFTPLTGPTRAEAREALGVDAHVALIMSRLVPIKGVDVALEALRALPSITLIVAGEGPERERLEASAKRLGVRARFVGYVEGASKAALLSAADLFLLPSVQLASGRTEGSPVALLEAMGSGLCVVASDTGGVRERVAHGVDGVRVPAGDPGALAAALRELCEDAAARRRLGEAAVASVAPLAWGAQVARLEAQLAAATLKAPRSAHRRAR